jgi:topoisomerase-4 subunit A
VAQAAITLIEKPQTSLDELLDIVQGPDYPTEAEIITPARRSAKSTRTAAVRCDARGVAKEDGAVVISALPHQVSARVLEQIAAQMRNKKLPMVDDLRDESDHENPTSSGDRPAL